MRRSCSNCPWRLDAPRRHWDNKHFLTIYQTCQDDGAHLMLCHKSKRAASTPRVCQGWVRVMQNSAIGVRLAQIRGLVTEEEMADTGGPDLFTTFRVMLIANGIRPPTRNRVLGKL